MNASTIETLAGLVVARVAERLIKTRGSVLGVSIRAVAKTPRAAVKKLLRLEERVLRELLKGRV